MLIDGLRIDGTQYGVYRPAFDNHEYRNVHLSRLGSEPFNRGMDDASAQNGSITVDGLKLEHFRNDSQAHPLVHMTDNNLSGHAECHFRNVVISEVDQRRAIFNRGGSQRVNPFVGQGVPYFIHDYYGAGRHARLVSLRATDLQQDGLTYREEPPLTGDESRVAEVTGLTWPRLLDLVDDLPPATIITALERTGTALRVSGVTHDNGEIVEVLVNGRPATVVRSVAGVTDWFAEFAEVPGDGFVAGARDAAGNQEQTPHLLKPAVK